MRAQPSARRPIPPVLVAADGGGSDYRPRHAGAPSRFRLLFVCTGNICRSPMAERLARAMLAEHLPSDHRRFEIASAGTWGHEGAPMEPYAAQSIARYGATGDAFTGRELHEDHIAAADLVLTATREHCSQVTSMGPDAETRTFTLKEFHRLATALDTADLPDDDPVTRARALVARVADERLRRGPQEADVDDVADPYGAPLSVYETCAAEIADALGPVVSRMAGAD